jgi:hypothetical protein
VQACVSLGMHSWRKRKAARLALRLAYITEEGIYCLNGCTHKNKSMLLLTVHFRILLPGLVHTSDAVFAAQSPRAATPNLIPHEQTFREISIAKKRRLSTFDNNLVFSPNHAWVKAGLQISAFTCSISGPHQASPGWYGTSRRTFSKAACTPAPGRVSGEEARRRRSRARAAV